MPVSGSAAQAPPRRPTCCRLPSRAGGGRGIGRTWARAAAATHPQSTLPGAPTGPVSGLALAPRDHLTHTREPGAQPGGQTAHCCSIAEQQQAAADAVLRMRGRRRWGHTAELAGLQRARDSARVADRPARVVHQVGACRAAGQCRLLRDHAVQVLPAWKCAGEVPPRARMSRAGSQGAGDQADGGGPCITKDSSAQTHPSSSWRSGCH